MYERNAEITSKNSYLQNLIIEILSNLLTFLHKKGTIKMKHSELISIITKQTGKTPTQNEIAEVLGLSKNAISSRSHRDAKYDYGEVEKLQNFFWIPI